MKKTISGIGILLLLLSCGAYKQLKPKPEVITQEGNYIQLLKGDKPFEVKAGKRYYIEFPAPGGDEYVLALRTQNTESLDFYLTQNFDNKPDTQDPRIPDQSAGADLAAYNVNTGFQSFFWVIENVPADQLVSMEYRYLPRWRYRFETKYSAFQNVLLKEKSDRSTFETLGRGSSASIDFGTELKSLQQKSEALQSMRSDLMTSENIFPTGIRGSDDRAYLDFQGLKSEVDAELRFQEDYRIALKALQIARESRFNNELFVRNLPDVMAFFENEDRYPENVRREVADAVANRLTEIVPYYENLARRQRELKPINFPAEAARKLFQRTNQQPDERFNAFTRFVTAFNRDLSEWQDARRQLNDIDTQLRRESWPGAAVFNRARGQVSRLQGNLPGLSRSDYGRYSSYAIVQQLEREITAVNNRAAELQRGLGVAENLADQINQLQGQGDYRGIIRLLKQHSDVAFLREQYGDVDQRSIDQQTADIRRSLDNQNFAEAERRIQSLYNDREFLDEGAFAERRLALSKQFEEELLQAIEKTSKDRISGFIQANQGAIDDVEALYNATAFQPTHTVTFSAGGQNVVDRYNQRLQQYLDSFKYDQFPKTSVQAIYNDFVQNPQNNGITKAQAVITHGKYYKGRDKRTRNMIAEIDPSIPKWITKATEYRRIFVLPTNTTQQQDNTYQFRVNLQIPSEAKFPVFDVNIKLPREVAKNARAEQWFQSMTLNGQPLKSEGRFTITAPTERNEFESQVTPLQVKKDGDNILEVRFNHPAFKVLEISVMAQRPIIRRD